MKKAKPVLILIVKLVVSTGLLVYLLSRIHIERFWGTFASADFSYIALALIVYLFTQTFSALRWVVLARPLGFAAPFKDIVVYYLIGMFFNLFAPGTVGGDVSRVYYLARDGDQGAPHGWARSTLPAALSVFMDRAVGMLVLVWLGAIGLALFPRYGVPQLVRYVTFTLALGFIVAGICVPLLRRVLPDDGHPLVVKLRLALRSYRHRWKVIPQAMILSLVIHLIQAWMHLILGRAIGIDIPFSYCLILYPLVGTFAAIPISLNGIGLREGGYVVLLGVIGVNSTQGVAFGLLLFSIVVLDSLIGGLAFLLKKGPRPSAVA
ncbi:MAG: flippase-like domain-containing protein [Deltaproteobacteria bacterium]|nr:flippase-like domain-containing protein [Deltaproteobacteria bacterium]MBI2532405.1 flippase-like domain-containing protein [Deltaproteobacteria bacterium]